MGVRLVVSEADGDVVGVAVADGEADGERERTAGRNRAADPSGAATIPASNIA